jgi:hypothetical protein
MECLVKSLIVYLPQKLPVLVFRHTEPLNAKIGKTMPPRPYEFMMRGVDLVDALDMIDRWDEISLFDKAVMGFDVISRASEEREKSPTTPCGQTR